jgi:putative transcriptional regulator
MKNKIKELKMIKMTSQDQLAQVFGAFRQTINAIKRNKYNPNLELSFQLAEHLEVRVDELFLFRNRAR